MRNLSQRDDNEIVLMYSSNETCAPQVVGQQDADSARYRPANCRRSVAYKIAFLSFHTVYTTYPAVVRGAAAVTSLHYN